jgi:hypothetical protein
VQYILPLHREFGCDRLVFKALGSPKHNLCPGLDRWQIRRNNQSFEDRAFRGGDYHVFIILEPGTVVAAARRMNTRALTRCHPAETVEVVGRSLRQFEQLRQQLLRLTELHA